ncbi:sine oculis-binding protein homolog [Anabrus simplex]|uniref:sine oculis-binding protein homolog n=1 Tax=Anabrus simplex TaxID=316456 RepID=UPI0035A2FFD2
MRVVMGSRSSPPTVAASSAEAPRLLSTIKKESPDDEIKEYAETAMNELLGWYGYDKLDSRDTQGLNLHHFAQRSPSDGESSDAGGSSPGRHDGGTGTGSSQGSPPLSDPTCAWCQKSCRAQQLFSLRTPTGQKAFCSEVCFTQCRRANFKRNKTCDWCRHVRHTVNYVDFQDGEHQLQFCSDKCLNQYKMNIFCKETQAHLQLHPHLQEGAAGAGGALITPDLWLRDCRSDSPVSDRSSSPAPAPAAKTSPPPDPHSTKLRRQCRPKRGSIRVIAPATVTSVAGPTDLRTTSSSSPRSGGSVSPPKHLLPPILHPPPHLIPPHDQHLPRPAGPFLPPAILPPPPHVFPEGQHHPHFQRFPLLRPPPRGSPSSPTALHPPPPLLPLPPRPPPPRMFLPPITIMVPYPIILPIPLPIPIPIPLFGQKKTEEENSTVSPPLAPSSAPAVAAEPKVAGRSAASERPLRKRKREVTSDDEAVSKCKSVPV